MTTNSYYDPPAPQHDQPVIPGLSPDALRGLSVEAIMARSTEAAQRQAQGDRHAAARRLADRVEALPVVKPQRPAAPAPADSDLAKTSQVDEPRARGDRVIRTTPTPRDSAPVFDEDDVRTLLGLLNSQHRKPSGTTDDGTTGVWQRF